MNNINDIYFDKPATDFLEALPIGNGRLGAVVFGEVLREQLILNENSVWSGSSEDSDRDDAKEYLPEIRRLLADGQNYEAERLFEQHFTCKGIGSNYAHGSDAQFGCYQVLGRLLLSYFQALSVGRNGSYAMRNYSRRLDLNTGIAVVAFETDNITYTREYLVSKENEAIYVHLTSSEKGKISFSLGLDRDECFEVKKLDSRTLLMTGQLDDGKAGTDGVRYASSVSVTAVNGSFKDNSSRIYLAEADEATIVITARTDMAGFMGHSSDDAYEQLLKDINKSVSVPFDQVKEDYIKWYSDQMCSSDVTFGNSAVNASLTTPERIKRFAAGENDPELLSLYIRFSKHLIICSCQKDGIPANLQGIWSDEIRTPWNGDWHLNAQQQIYWLVEKAGLSDSHLPFLELTRSLVEPGSVTAKKYYDAKGWIVHTMTNPWGFTAPLENASWGSTTGSSAWQCHHLFEHYLYTRDSEYLADVYLIMKGAAQFYMDMLVEDKVNGYLVTSPSSSPENIFLDEQGRRCSLCEGPSYDRQLVASLFDYCIQAQYVLQNDPEFLAELKKLRGRLAPVEIAPDGRIREWGRDYTECLPFHRHLSHLWGVYPGNQISYEKTPELASAAAKSLLRRGSTTAGWATAYRQCVAARLRNSEEAYACLKDAMTTSAAPNLMNLAYHCDETVLHHDLPDTAGTKYQFQLDGNQANATGILLMLLDDDAVITEDGKLDVTLYLLPALPKALPSGKAKDLRAKGGLSVSLDWEAGKLISAVIEGTPGMKFDLVYDSEKRTVALDSEGRYHVMPSAFC